MSMTAPAARPVNPRFSSGPCAKIPQFSLDMLEGAPLGRSHRAAVGKAKLAEAIELTRRFLRTHGDDWDIECEVRPLDGPEFGRQP